MSLATTLDTLSGRYVMNPEHSRIGFVARHAMVTKVRGSFSDFQGEMYLDASNPSYSWVEVRIQAKSIDTGVASRDDHLRSSDFLDMDNYPEIVFKSTSVEQLNDENYRVSGDLTIKAITKPVTIDMQFTGVATDTDGEVRVGFEGSTKINRKDWGVSWNAALATEGFVVSEEVAIELDVSAIKVSPR